MFKVTYSYYGKYQHEKTFSTEQAAKKFFWYVQRRTGVTRVQFSAA